MVAASTGSAQAMGIVSDGTSTAIAVFQMTNVNSYQDVTFTVDNGATLAPWDGWFLTQVPAAWSTSDSNTGSTTLDVPYTSLIPCGSGYCALALVRLALHRPA